MKHWHCRIVCVGALVAAALLAWDSRHVMKQDGLTYLDMAVETTRNGPVSLVNGMWSPLYPGLIAILMVLFVPSPAMEFPLVHLLNWILFSAAMLSFYWFLRTWRPVPPASRLWDCFALLTCFWVLLQLNGVAVVSPDLAVAAIVFLAARWVCLLATGGSKPPILLGLTLAAGYYAKTSMFPMALLLFAVLWFWPPGGRGNRRNVLLAGAVFLLASAPLVSLISQRLGRLSIGDSGKLNYVWHVNGFHPYMGWTAEDDPAHGMPAHAPRVLSNSPVILEFGSAVPGTYPLWYDPSYWHEGLRARISIRQQLRAIADNLWVYYYTALELIPLLAGLLALGLLRRRIREGASAALLREAGWMAAWPATILCSLSLVHVEGRYVAPFLVLLLLAVYWPLANSSSEAGRGVLATVCIVIALSGLVLSFQAASRSVRDWRAGKRPDNQVAAEWLTDLGLRRGDTIAMIGYSFDVYFAHLAGVRLAAQIPDTDAFGKLTAQEVEKIKVLLAAQGIRALVVRDGPVRWPDWPGWQAGCGECAVKYRALILQ